MSDLIGQRLGQYEITGMIGMGGMATVYRARQTSIDRDVAIKIIKPDLAQAQTQAKRDEFLKRFEREARTVASLSTRPTRPTPMASIQTPVASSESRTVMSASATIASPSNRGLNTKTLTATLHAATSALPTACSNVDTAAW